MANTVVKYVFCINTNELIQTDIYTFVQFLFYVPFLINVPIPGILESFVRETNES